MAQDQLLRKKKPVVKTIGYGLVSVAMYAAVFTHAGTVMSFFTRGGWYAALPVATVFLFSFVHGSFANNLWTLLGIEALQKDTLRQTDRKISEQRKQVQRRRRVYAYVNPFHRM